MAETSVSKRKQGDTYPFRAQIKDAAGAVDMTNAVDIVLTVAARPTRSVTPTVKASAAGAPEAGTNGWVSFPVAAPLAELPPGEYDAEIQFTIGAHVFTTDTFSYSVGRQLA